MILTREGKEIVAIYKQDGNEVDEVKDANGRIVYTNTREITGTLPLSFTSRGKPLSDYRISGNTVQNGTPTPDAPVDVVGCGVRTGNLFDKDATDTANGYIIDGFLKSDGSITPTAGYRASEYIRISQNQSYNLYYSGVLNIPSVCFYDSEKKYISGIAYAGRQYVSFTTPQNTVYLRLSFYAGEESSVMLNTGSTALPYEPYGYKLPLTINSTEYPIYLGEVESTRRIKKLVFTGEEYWSLYRGNYYSSVTDRYSLPNMPCRCTHTAGGILIDIGSVRLKVLASRFTTVASNLEEWKSYLAQQYSNGTPVTIWYVLATPETAVVNEPLMKIGNYGTDTVTMAQAGVAIPTIRGTNVLGMLSPVKPSEVYIKGKGIRATT